MNELIIDFETYYDKDITLKKLNYSEYAPKAKPILLTVLHNNQLHTIADADIGPYLDSIKWDDTILIGHNLMFDALILKHWYGHQAAYHMDTLSMARYLYPTMPHGLGDLQKVFLPGAKIKDHTALSDAKGHTWDTLPNAVRLDLIAYNRNDVVLTKELFNLFNPQLPKKEHDLIDWTLKLWLNPTLELDTALCERAIKEEYDKTTEMLQHYGLDATTVRSNAKFFVYLKERGFDPPVKSSPTTGKLVPAFAKTDSAFKEFCEYNSIEDLYELKQNLNSNIKTSRAETMLKTATENNGRIPVAYNYHGAFTGRFSGGNRINLQNLPRGGTLRYALKAPEGFTLVACDLSQIEARVLAWLAGEQKILDAFIAKKDLYCEVASDIFGKTITPDNPAERFVGKAAVLGLGYGMGANKFQLFCKNMGKSLDFEFCNTVVQQYRSTYPNITKLWNLFNRNIVNMRVKDIINEDFGAKQPTNDKVTFEYERLILPSGRALFYRDLSPSGGNMWTMQGGRKVYGALLVENCVQAISYDILKESILALKDKWNIVLTTHDEIVVCCKDEDVDQATHALLETMCTAPTWGYDLPLDAKAGHGKNYGECK